jgi:hypothetical protein
MNSRIRLHVAVLLSLCALGATAPSALAHDGAAATAAAKSSSKQGGGRQAAKLSLRLKGLKHGKLTVGNRIKALGTMRPFVGGQKVTVLLHRGKKKTIKRVTVPVTRKSKKSSLGQFEFSKRLIQPGRYSVEAVHAKNANVGGSKTESRRFHIRYPDLSYGATGDAVKVFNTLLAKLGYVNDEGGTYDSATGRAVLAYHKVNNEPRKESSSSGMFKKLAKGKGGYNLKHPGAGHHVEVDLSRQVMVLAKDGEVDEIYTVSTGKSTTPTILGKFHFYRKEPGYNSHAMYYSVYFQGGYATHGYASVPDYPASHGCLRSPIPDARHIYNWIDLGDAIYVYH